MILKLCTAVSLGVRTVRYLFIAALAPAITFGSRFLDGTNGQFGVLEMLGCRSSFKKLCHPSSFEALTGARP